MKNLRLSLTLPLALAPTLKQRRQRLSLALSLALEPTLKQRRQRRTQARAIMDHCGPNADFIGPARETIGNDADCCCEVMRGDYGTPVTLHDDRCPEFRRVGASVGICPLNRPPRNRLGPAATV